MNSSLSCCYIWSCDYFHLCHMFCPQNMYNRVKSPSFYELIIFVLIMKGDTYRDICMVILLVLLICIRWLILTLWYSNQSNRCVMYFRMNVLTLTTHAVLHLRSILTLHLISKTGTSAVHERPPQKYKSLKLACHSAKIIHSHYKNR